MDKNPLRKNAEKTTDSPQPQDASKSEQPASTEQPSPATQSKTLRPHTEAAALLNSMSSGKEIISIAFAPDGSQFATGAGDGTLEIWDREGNSLLKESLVTDHPGMPLLVAYSPNGKVLAVGDKQLGGRIKFYVLAKKSWLPELPKRDELKRLAWLDTSQLFTMHGARGQERFVHLWKLPGAKKEERKYPAGKGLFGAIAVSPDGSRLAVVIEREIVLYDVASGAERGKLAGHTDDILSLAFSPDGKRLASGTSGAAWVWDLETSQPVQKLAVKNWVNAVFFSPSGSRLFAVANSVKAFDASTGEEVTYEFGERPDTLTSAALSADGERMVLGFLSGKITLMDTHDVVAD